MVLKIQVLFFMLKGIIFPLVTSFGNNHNLHLSLKIQDTSILACQCSITLCYFIYHSNMVFTILFLSICSISFRTFHFVLCTTQIKCAKIEHTQPRTILSNFLLIFGFKHVSHMHSQFLIKHSKHAHYTILDTMIFLHLCDNNHVQCIIPKTIIQKITIVLEQPWVTTHPKIYNDNICKETQPQACHNIYSRHL